MMGSLFLTIPNADVFQPFKYTTYSVGAIYAVVLNLPQNLRYKRENVLLIGLIPGPQEPQKTMNSYLQPLTTELLVLWEDGFSVNIANIGTRVVKCAVLCVACHLPAGRKMCGFLGHNARLGCSRCYKEFPGSVGSMDFSGFDVHAWPKRTGDDHRATARTLKNFKTVAEEETKESEKGCRYSVLLQLPYFDAPRMLIVDPMHNLFLGTAKHFVKAALIEKNLISDAQFGLIQARLSATNMQIQLGKALLQFCKRSQHLYGRTLITPNMHIMHMHLSTCFEDYGPSHGFWLFAFERYNGILGSTPNNSRSVEVQLLNRFLNDNNVLNAGMPTEFSDDFQSEFTRLAASHSNVGSLADTFQSSTLKEDDTWKASPQFVLSSTRYRYNIGETQLLHLKFLLSK